MKFIGTIIDKSYFEPYRVINKYNNHHLYKICKICLEPIDLGFSKDENSGFAGTLPHICEKFKEVLTLQQQLHLSLSDVSKFSPELKWGQFIFLNNPPLKLREEGGGRWQWSQKAEN